MAADAHRDDVVDERGGLVDRAVAQELFDHLRPGRVEHDLGQTDRLGAVHEAERQQAVGAASASERALSMPSAPACRLLALASPVTALPVTGSP